MIWWGVLEQAYLLAGLGLRVKDARRVLGDYIFVHGWDMSFLWGQLRYAVVDASVASGGGATMWRLH